MITGASNSDLIIVLVDARNGLQTKPKDTQVLAL